jgi:hypothetical protein
VNNIVLPTSEDILQVILFFGLVLVVFIAVAYVIFLSKDSNE